MDSLKKSFKQVHTKILASGGGVEEQQKVWESKPILSDLDEMKSIDSSSGHKDIVLNISDEKSNNSRDLELGVVELNNNNNGGNLWRGSSYDFWRDNNNGGSSSNGFSSNGNGGDGFDFQLGQNQQKKVKNIEEEEEEEDPPSKLIGQFLHKQKASGEISLDMDLEMEELGGGLQTIAETPRSPINQQVPLMDVKVLPEEAVRRRSNASPNRNYSGVCSYVSSEEGGDRGEILRCTSNASFKRKSGFLKTKTMKSRLMDQPIQDEHDRRSGRPMKSAQLKSGFMGKAIEEDEDDPFAEEDLPEEFKKDKFNTMTLLQWVSLILILAALVCSLVITFLRKRQVWNLDLWKWILLVFVLMCGRLVSGWGIRIVVFFIERNFLLRKRVLYFVYGVRKAVQNCLWLGLVLLAWHYMFDDKVKREIHGKTLPYTITKILIALLVTTLIWLVKTLLVKVLASSFHVSTYFDRIQESLFNQYVIEALSGPPTIEIKNNQEEEEKVIAEVQKLQNAGANMPADLKATMRSGRVIGSGGLQPRSPQVRKSFKSSGRISKPQDEGITIDQLHKLNQKNVSAWNMKRLMNIVRHGVLSTLEEQIHGSAHDDDASKQIRNEFEAKCAAKKIFHNVASPGSKCIYLEDLMRFMREDEACKTMSLFEGAAETKRVKKAALKNWVVNAFRERKALALTLDDTKTAVNQLHHMVNAVMGIIILIIWLLILGIATTQLLVVVSSQLLLVAFMFGNTCKMVFEAIIFLFVMHPFDVGDRCEIDGVQMVVEEMNILTTVFLRFDNQKIIYPNSVLSVKPISNYYRSPDMGDAIDFCVHISTPAEKIALMKKKITEYIEKKTEHWQPAPLVVVRDVEDLNRLKMSVWPTHRMNHQDMGERWVRRAFLVEEMIKIFRDLDIEYRMLPLDVNMRNMPSLNSIRLPSNWTACTN
ncbi:Mechanosensitive ion channel protein [Thalictrum thalictroides]|uniref:Mechanosensitive ion channel protein n=1 Tax=Thalictrum thalictroides TaxID=46969 RepID=A0A7J6VSQ2_THATH|nr:Mechanosensitive ion channel protein [Thalictrum thalictroides]